MQQRKIPLRRCTGCNEQKPKKELVRVVRSPQGEIALDRVGKMPGRGAYLCPSRECVEKAVRGRGIERSFKMPVSGEVYEKLGKELEAIEKEQDGIPSGTGNEGR